jgi:hypothetical protein
MNRQKRAGKWHGLVAALWARYWRFCSLLFRRDETSPEASPVTHICELKGRISDQ